MAGSGSGSGSTTVINNYYCVPGQASNSTAQVTNRKNGCNDDDISPPEPIMPTIPDILPREPIVPAIPMPFGGKPFINVNCGTESGISRVQLRHKFREN
ncbi:hypothetical protein BGX21_001886 [Mortierella sp. AD011]|nr:hypothetical protein BGX21_001886 [Mortierella sp. AD011]